ncbi:PAS domain-containing sensor histidine kinase [Tepidibacillus fermentans]|uniref:Oxygen sensor histidine kinase NreB n=1 Tax=Tepidibacillus fermentans TaxID=1281767 RepID=A0A4R3KM72_9BACI|nr:histidine kinase [Tepidibacillus fermentans]TCS84566.1 two-component system sensor histidine kinase NreB [Tepidibacillus fermentans]
MSNQFQKQKWLFKVLLSTGISLLFVFVVMISFRTIDNGIYRYLLLFTISFIFSSILFHFIFRKDDELKAERERLIKVFEHVSDGIMILDENKNVVEMNQAAKDFLGHDIKPESFCHLCEDSHGSLKICEYDKCFLNQQRLSYYELQLKHENGSKIPVSVSTSHYLDVDQKPLTIISIRNLSDHRRGEQSRITNIVTASMIRAQEEERKRLSRELHDGIGQSIFSVLLGIEYVMPLIENESIREHLENLRKTTKQTLEELRHMAVELRPSALDDLGLIAALKSYMKTFGDTFGIQVNFEYSGDKDRLPASVETALYRISQEALTNVAKYADCDRVDLTMCKKMNEVILKVTDYGKGFSVDDLRRHDKGVGLYGMEERASMLGGTFRITSQLGKGTEIEVHIPLQKEEENGQNQNLIGG